MVAFLLAFLILATLVPATMAAPAIPTGLAATSDPGTEPVLTWSPVAGATDYRVQVATSDAFNPVVFDLATKNTTATPTAGLQPAPYRWRVAARAAGQWSAWSTAGSFVRSSLDLDVPTLVTPDDTTFDGFTDVPRIEWAPVDGAARYDLEMARAADMSDSFAGETRTSHVSLHLLVPGEPIYWRVRAVGRDGVSTSDWSAIRSVAVALETVPSGLTPPSGTSARETVVTWDPLPGAAGYDLQIAPIGEADWDASDVHTAQPRGTWYEFDDEFLAETKTYRWRVRAFDGSGRRGPWTAERTITRTLSTAPSLLAPSNGAETAEMITLNWSPVLGASWYSVEVAPDASFATMVSAHRTTETIYDLTTREEQDPHVLVKGHTYYWRVRGFDAPVGLQNPERPASPWSAVRSFKYEPEVSELLLPADGATVSIPTLTWDGRARFHRVTIKDADGAIVDQRVTWASTYTPQVLLDPADGPFTWYVERVALPGGPGSTVAWRSVERTFDLTSVVTGASLTLLNPAGYHTLDNPRIRWTPIAGAASYDIVAPPAPTDTVIDPWNDGPLVYPDYTFPESTWDSGQRLYQVWAYDDDGDVIAKSVTSNWTIDRPSRPVITAPDQCPEIGCPAFAEPPPISWEPVEGARFYSITAAGAGLPTAGGVTSDTQFHLWRDLQDAAMAGAVEVIVYACIANRCGEGSQVDFRMAGAVPQLVSPADGASITGPEVALDWSPLKDSAVAPGTIGTSLSEPDRYQVDVLNADGGAGAATNGTERRLIVLSPGTYHWQVRGETTGVKSTGVADRTFSLTWAGPDPTSPAAGANVERTPPLDWEAMPYTDAYEVEVYAGGSILGTPVMKQTTPSPGFSPPEELGAGQYTWRVRSALDGSHSSWSTPRTFTVDLADGPSVVGPDGDEVDADGLVTFDWAPFERASAYRLQVGHTADFSGSLQTIVTGQSAWANTAPFEGHLYWRVFALGPSNAAIAVSETASFSTPDAVPTTTTPSVQFVSGSRITSGKVLVRLAWTGSDIGSGVARYEVAQSTDSGTWVTLTTSLTTARFDRLVTALHQHRFRVRAVDYSGNVGSWSTTPTMVPQRYSENNRRVGYSGSWSTRHDPVFWGGASKKSTKSGSTASITFVGRSISWVARKGPTRGKAAVYVDGNKVAIVDLHATSGIGPVTVWAGHWSSSKSRKVTVRVLGTSGHPRVDIDAFVTLP